MSDNEKLDLINVVWKPTTEYVFPQHEESGRRIRFSHSYISPDSPKFFKWLAYSAYYDGVFCVPCVLFGQKLDKTKLTNLFRKPLTRWNGMISKLKDHENKSPLHRIAIDVMHSLTDQQKGSLPIDTVIDDKRRNRIMENRKKMIPIIKTVIFCARQNISLRGHRDDSKYLDDLSNNPGNFQALLQFRVDSGDKDLANHFQTCPRNATYHSKTIQNEIIKSMGKFIRQKLSNEIKEARFFSVIADEASDCSNVEQMALVIRFIDENSEVREEFVQFIQCAETGAEYLSNKIIEAVQSLSLDMNNLRGQAYDGAGNMAGAISGVSTRIQRLYPKAFYFHCASHRLNLAVASSTAIRCIRNMMDSIRKCCETFRFSPKKNFLLRTKIKEMMSEDMRNTLLDVCKTRWLQRIDGLERVQEMIKPILETLDMISNNYDGSFNKDARNDAQGIYWTFKSFHFIVHLIIVRFVMSYTLPLTYELQEKQLDVVKVYKAVDTVIQSLKECREQVDTQHAKWFKEVVDFAKTINVVPCVKRIAGQQTL